MKKKLNVQQVMNKILDNPIVSLVTHSETKLEPQGTIEIAVDPFSNHNKDYLKDLYRVLDNQEFFTWSIRIDETNVHRVADCIEIGEGVDRI